MRLVLFLLTALLARAEITAGPFPPEPPINQLRVFDNSCGPVALYNSLNFGGEPWREIVRALDKETPKEKIRLIVRRFGSRPSWGGNGARRWNGRFGINAQNLTLVANDMRQGRRLPELQLNNYFQGQKEKNTKVLKRLYKDMRESLRNGFPPLATLQRYRTSRLRSGRVIWRLAQSHFVSIVGIPEKLKRNAETLAVSYVDPWGGKFLQGTINAPPTLYPPKIEQGASFNPNSPPSAPVADFSETRVGLSSIPRGEASVLIVGGLIFAN